MMMGIKVQEDLFLLSRRPMKLDWVQHKDMIISDSEHRHCHLSASHA